jgi:dolichol-phosphate mannosyltransferase
MLSKAANAYARLATGLPLTDCTSGFKCFRAGVLRAIGLERLRSDGYAFQVEVSYKAWKRGFRIKEIPILFVDRRSGESKLSAREVREAVWRVWTMRLQKEEP